MDGGFQLSGSVASCKIALTVVNPSHLLPAAPFPHSISMVPFPTTDTGVLVPDPEMSICTVCSAEIPIAAEKSSWLVQVGRWAVSHPSNPP